MCVLYGRLEGVRRAGTSGSRVLAALGSMTEKQQQVAERLKSAVVNAVVWKEYERLPSLLRRLSSLTPTPELLRATGIGHLVADRKLWGLAGTQAASMGQLLSMKWRKCLRQASSTAQASSTCSSTRQPFGGLRAVPFMEAVEDMKKQMSSAIHGHVDVNVMHKCAVALVLHGFRQLQQIDGISTDDLSCLELVPAEKAMLKELIEVVQSKAKRRRQERIAVTRPAWLPGHAGCSTNEQCGPVHGAKDLAESLSALEVNKAHEAVEKQLEAWNAEGVGTRLTPSQATEKLAVSQEQGAPVLDILLMRAATLRVETKRASLPQVAAALRSWHAFAVAILELPATGTLPPRLGEHVEAYAATFKNAATAANYVSAMKWACVHLGLCTAWYTPGLQMTMKGAKQYQLRVSGGTKHAAKFLDDKTLANAVKLADLNGMSDFAVLMLVAWSFLLRVQSECLLMEAGHPDDEKDLPQGRHSGLWLESGSVLCLRLRRRKNRPSGSMLRRPCSCSTTGPGQCVVHRAAGLLQRKSRGQRLWAVTEATALSHVRRLLSQLGIGDACRYTLKAFRAGRATALAVAGCSIGDILRAGEWRSAAFLCYINEDDVDKAQLLNNALADSDGENVTVAEK